MQMGGIVERLNKEARDYAELATNAEILLRELHRLQSHGKNKASKEVMAAMHATRILLERP